MVYFCPVLVCGVFFSFFFFFIVVVVVVVVVVYKSLASVSIFPLSELLLTFQDKQAQKLTQCNFNMLVCSFAKRPSV